MGGTLLENWGTALTPFCPAGMGHATKQTAAHPGVPTLPHSPKK